MKHSRDKFRFFTPKNLLIALFVLFVVFSLINTIFISNLSGQITEKISLAEEQSRPAEIEVTTITISKCKECYDAKTALEDLKKQNVNITKEESFDYESDKGKQLVELYRIGRLPTLIIRGETNKTDQLQRFWDHVGEQRGTNYETVLYTNIIPPYYDMFEERIVGRVSITSLVDSSCGKCVSLAGIVGAFKQAGVKIVEEKTVEYKSEEGRQLVSKFGVREIPALIISKDILDYDSIKQIWKQLNTTEKEGFFALHSTIPPYIDVSTDKVVGLVTLIMLNDKTCNICYDVLVNKQIIARFGIATDKEFSYDVNSDEGKDLINKYKITKVPIIILSPETNVYDSFTQVWDQVGTIENDGWYVMRSPGVLGAYKDLSTNQIVQPQQQGTSTRGG
jgi:thiol-disulfide isomerase/thioredoxin